MKIRKNGVWEDYKYPIYESATDTITSLPTDIIADGQPVAAWTISGNMQQTGTPTPENPIYPQETGERTGNLFDWNWLVDGYHLSPQTGLPVDNTRRTSILQSIDVALLGRLYLSFTRVDNDNIKAMYSVLTNDDTLVRRVTNVDSGDFLDVSGGSKLYIAFYDSLSSVSTVTKDNVSNVMLNPGSTALPYEPYGFKIPISSANTTTPVYLGEVESTRQIRKLVFDGTETWYKTSGNRFNYQILSDTPLRFINCICTHYIGTDITSYASLQDGQCTTSIVASDIPRFAVSDDNYTEIATFKDYLAQQYAAGTPVCVWYVLATPTTGIVNEPLRKIGDYADTISNVAEIPTTAGEQTFDVDTSLKPSSVEITYKGWHKHTPKEYDNGSWS